MGRGWLVKRVQNSKSIPIKVNSASKIKKTHKLCAKRKCVSKSSRSSLERLSYQPGGSKFEEAQILTQVLILKVSIAQKATLSLVTFSSEGRIDLQSLSEQTRGDILQLGTKVSLPFSIDNIWQAL